MEINLKKLAQELNLSISTVSRALQDSHEVGSATKQRVQELAKKLNYQPHPYASSLRKRKSKTIAVVVPEIANNFFSLVINGIESIAQENGYHVLIYLTHEDYEKEISIIRHLQSGRVDGVIMSVSSETDDISHLKELQKKQIPIVFFDRVCNEIETARVTTDDYESGIKATRHLIESQCKNIAYLQISPHLSIGQKRLEGYVYALKQADFPLNSNLILSCTNDNEENFKLLKNLLISNQAIDGIFASVEKLAITSYYVCQDLKIPIPQKLKIIGFSNLDTAPLLSPSLTTITQPAFDIGYEAAKLLFIGLKKYNAINHQEKIVLSSKLIKRNSTSLSF
jgi:LacI family transcriptional regulator